MNANLTLMYGLSSREHNIAILEVNVEFSPSPL